VCIAVIAVKLLHAMTAMMKEPLWLEQNIMEGLLAIALSSNDKEIQSLGEIYLCKHKYAPRLHSHK